MFIIYYIFFCILIFRNGYGQDIIYNKQHHLKYNDYIKDMLVSFDVMNRINTTYKCNDKDVYIKQNEQTQYNQYNQHISPLPVDFYNKLIMLNIGGVTPTDGWYNVNVQDNTNTNTGDDINNNNNNNNNLILREMDDLRVR